MVDVSALVFMLVLLWAYYLQASRSSWTKSKQHRSPRSLLVGDGLNERLIDRNPFFSSLLSGLFWSRSPLEYRLMCPNGKNERKSGIPTKKFVSRHHTRHRSLGRTTLVASGNGLHVDCILRHSSDHARVRPARITRTAASVNI
jgi:hypothetical protein